MQAWLAILSGAALGASVAATSAAVAQESTRGAQEDPSIEDPQTGGPAAGAAPSTPPSTPPPSSGIEEIVVLGAESEAAGDFDAADSVAGFSAADLEALGAKDIADLAAFTPNLEIVTSGATTPTFFIRGVGLNDFNANSTGAVALYQDDVPINAPALQLGTLYDVEGVNVLRGPQGSGAARNASAGAIKIYTRKPSGEFGGYFRGSYGNFDYRDFEGAIEAPIYEDILATRLAFRLSEREGWGENGCANLPPVEERPVNSSFVPTSRPPFSLCGEEVDRFSASAVPEGLPKNVNNLDNWAARGTFLFQPTLDATIVLNGHGSRRDEQSRLGQALGTNQGTPLPGGGVQNVVLGGRDAGNYQAQEVKDQIAERQAQFRAQGQTPIEAQANARFAVAKDLARDLDTRPLFGDYNSVGPTQNDTWGTYLRAEVVLPNGMSLTSVSAYDAYDRLVDLDLDFSPNELFEVRTDDEGWQVTQDLKLSGQVNEELRYDLGGYYLQEELEADINNRFGQFQAFGVSERQYAQNLWSFGLFSTFAWDFSPSFTLDAGARYNYEKKSIDYFLDRAASEPLDQSRTETWDDPTGFIRLTYRFREDTHAYWKYTRGWKAGTWNATTNPTKGVTGAEPENIDAFETGLRGSWLEGRLGVDVSLFYYNYQDYQIFTSENDAGSLPGFIIVNANEAEVFGSEVNLNSRPWQGAFFDVRFGWLEGQFLDFTQTQLVNVFQGGESFTFANEINNTGNRLLNSPRFKISLTAEQTIPLGRFGSLTGRYDGTWTDTVFYDATEGRGIPQEDNPPLPQPAIGQPAYWIHNLWFGYRPAGARFEISSWVRNLTNETYKSFAFDASTFQDTTIYFVGEPRTYGVTASVNF